MTLVVRFDGAIAKITPYTSGPFMSLVIGPPDGPIVFGSWRVRSPLMPKLAALGGVLPTLNPTALAVGLTSAGVIFFFRWFRPTWPGMLIAVGLAAIAAAFLHLPVETIGHRFGALPHGLPAPHLPFDAIGKWRQALPIALSFTLLGGVESLLSAKVADGMTGRKHRSNMELVAQGLANIASALFGGISVTGTIARTATNVRAGAKSPISGILHAVFLLVFLLVAAPLAAYVPLSALAGLPKFGAAGSNSIMVAFA